MTSNHYWSPHPPGARVAQYTVLLQPHQNAEQYGSLYMHPWRRQDLCRSFSSDHASASPLPKFLNALSWSWQAACTTLGLMIPKHP